MKMKKQWFKQMSISLVLMLLQYLAVYPLLMAIGSQIFDQSVLRYLWLLPLCSWVGFCLCLLFKKAPIMLIRSLFVIISLVLSVALFQTVGKIMAATVIFGLFFVLPSYQINGLFNQQCSMSNTLLLLGVLSYLLIGFYGQVAKIERIQHLLVLPSILFIILALFLTNYSKIQEAVRRGGKQQTISMAVIRQNRMMVIGILIVVLLISALNWLKQAIFSIVHVITSGVSKLIGWISSLFTHEEILEEIVEEGAKPDMGMMPPAGEPALIWVMLEKVMIAVAVFIIVLLIYLFIKKIFPKIYQWLKRLMSERQIFKMKQSSFDYSEEQESTFQTQKILLSIKKAWTKRQYKRFNERWTDAKTGAEKARFLYRYYLYQQVKKGIKPKLSQTPKEILEQDGCNAINTETIKQLEVLYEQARYGQLKEISKEQMERLKQNIMLMKK